MKATILYGDNLMDATYQEKSYKDRDKFIQWCRIHHKKIWMINGHSTLGLPFSLFELIDMLETK